MTEKTAKPEEARYISFDPFSGDRDVDVKLREVRIVTTRKPQQCLGSIDSSSHDMPAGTRARFEKSLVDGDYWGRYYVCLACMDLELAAAEGDE